MTIVKSEYLTSNLRWFEAYGKSNESKPISVNNVTGCRWIEIDTSKIYHYDADNSEWLEWGASNA